MSETRRQLELQSDRIEMVLTTHKSPARVTGGIVTPRAVQFHLAPALGTKINRVQSLAEELALALGVSSVRVSRQGGSMQLEIPRDDARPVKLLSLMAALYTTALTGPHVAPGDGVVGYNGVVPNAQSSVLRVVPNDASPLVMLSAFPRGAKGVQSVGLSIVTINRPTFFASCTDVAAARVYRSV